MAIDDDPAGGFRTKDPGAFWFGSDALPDAVQFDTDGNARFAGDVTVAGSLDVPTLDVSGAALGLVTPATHGLVAWTYDPVNNVNSSQLTAGTVYLSAVYPVADASITKIYWHLAVAAATVTADQNEVGLYDSSGTLLASTNVDDDITSADLIETAIDATNVTAGGMYWVGMVFNASTMPTIARGAGLSNTSAAINVGLTAASYRFATNGTSQTSLPASITPSSNTATTFGGPWVAIG